MQSSHYSVTMLLQVKRAFDEHPNAIFTVPDLWPEQRLTKAQWHAWFVACLDEKITSKMPRTALSAPRHGTANRRTRPCSICADCAAELSRAARALNSPRLAIYWLPSCLKGRFSHRLRDNRDL